MLGAPSHYESFRETNLLCRRARSLAGGGPCDRSPDVNVSGVRTRRADGRFTSPADPVNTAKPDTSAGNVGAAH